MTTIPPLPVLNSTDWYAHYSALDAAARAAYVKAAGGIPKTDLASPVQTSLGKADTALQSAPVASVAGRTGAVTLAKADVGLTNVDNTADVNKPVSAAQQAALDALDQYIFWDGAAWGAGRAAASIWIYVSTGYPNATTPNPGSHRAMWIPDKGSPIWASV